MAAAGLTYEQFDTAFRHRNFKPLYFLYGDERFLMDALQQTLIAHALAPHEHDFNLDLFYGAECEASEVLACCAGFPMMAERRVVIVRNFDKLKNSRLFTNYAERPNPTAVVLLIHPGKPNLSTHPFRAFRQHAVWGEFKPLYPNQIPGWIQQHVKKQGYQVDPKAIQVLADYVGNDLSTVAAEIEKLITYVGTRTRITLDDVVHASGQLRDFNVFELQKALGEGRLHDAMTIADRMLDHAANPQGEALMIVSVLTNYFTRLWKLTLLQDQRLTDQELAQKVGVSPFFIKEYLHSLRYFPPVALSQAFSALLAADYELKGGSHRNERLLMMLLMRRLLPPVQDLQAA